MRGTDGVPPGRRPTCEWRTDSFSQRSSRSGCAPDHEPGPGARRGRRPVGRRRQAEEAVEVAALARRGRHARLAADALVRAVPVQQAARPPPRGPASRTRDADRAGSARASPTRLLFAPILVALTAAAFVFSATHPAAGDRRRPGDGGPALRRGQLASADGDPPRRVDRAGRRRAADRRAEGEARGKLHPAVVLVHDFGRTPQQMPPYLAPLHDDGVVTMSVALRGSDPDSRVGQTFGLAREAADVAAAVEVRRAARSSTPPASRSSASAPARPPPSAPPRPT